MTLKEELLAIGTCMYSTNDIINSDTKIIVDIQKYLYYQTHILRCGSNNIGENNNKYYF